MRTKEEVGRLYAYLEYGLGQEYLEHLRDGRSKEIIYTPEDHKALSVALVGRGRDLEEFLALTHEIENRPENKKADSSHE